jgi:hypothetical protein
MSQAQVCSYCFLIQRAEKVDHISLSPDDVERYLVHLRVQHGVIFSSQITA